MEEEGGGGGGEKGRKPSPNGSWIQSEFITHRQDLIAKSHSSHGGWGSFGHEADEHALVDSVHGDTTLALLILAEDHLTDTWGRRRVSRNVATVGVTLKRVQGLPCMVTHAHAHMHARTHTHTPCLISALRIPTLAIPLTGPELETEATWRPAAGTTAPEVGA